MNGDSAEACAKKIRAPSRSSMRKMGASHHVVRGQDEPAPGPSILLDEGGHRVEIVAALLQEERREVVQIPLAGHVGLAAAAAAEEVFPGPPLGLRPWRTDGIRKRAKRRPRHVFLQGLTVSHD